MVQEATVGICAASGARGGRLWGSGLLVAPGWVLTCAHVLITADGRRRGVGKVGSHGESGAGDDVGIAINGKVVRGCLAYCLPAPWEVGSARRGAGADPEAYTRTALMIRPDLALIALLDDVPGQTCGWLSDRSDGPLGDALIIGRQDAPAGGAMECWDSYCHFAGQELGQLLLRSEARIRPGISGGPLVDVEKGEVVGIVKARDPDGTGGLAVPVAALRELSERHHVGAAPSLGRQPYQELLRRHDRWHANRQEPGNGSGSTWTDIQKQLPANDRDWSVLHRLTALELLAGLPAPPDPAVVARVVTRALRKQPRDWPVPPHAWRDGHGLLYEIDHRLEPRNFLRYLLLVAREAELRAGREANPGAARQARGLWGWAWKQARGLDARDREDLARIEPLPPIVLVEFEPLLGYDQEPPKFSWKIRFGYGKGEWRPAVATDASPGLTFDEAKFQVKVCLEQVLAQVDGDDAPARLEVALPDDKFATPVHHWRPLIAGTRPSVGVERAVVLRDVGRRGEPDARWSERWRRLAAAKRLYPLHLAPAGVAVSYGELTAGCDGAVPVLCRAVSNGTGQAVTRMVLESGYPVAIWRTDGHPEDGCERGCADFVAGIQDLLAAPGDSAPPGRVHDLPWQVWGLRQAAKDNGTAAPEWGEQIVLLYDDPDNPLPQA